MSANSEALRTLDIGGGTGIPIDQDETGLAIEQEMEDMRLVRLARSNPDGWYCVFDPHIHRNYARKLMEELPNLHFVVGNIKPDRQLPFPSESFDIVEMSFLFTPLRLQESVTQSVRDPFVCRYYRHAVREAGRVLKVGGTLRLCEWDDAVTAMRRIFRSDEYHDSDVLPLEQSGLQSFNERRETDITDHKRSIFTDIALNDKFGVLLLEVQKTSPTRAAQLNVE